MTFSKVLGFGFLAFLVVSITGTASVISWGLNVNNTMVTMNEAVSSQWSQVENVYQRRSDLIPNLVSTVKGYAKHENETLVGVATARAQAGTVKINANNAADLAKYEQAQGNITQALSKLMVISEKYPELKADTQFLQLQSQLEGTENRITIERQKFNNAAQEYNTYIKLAFQSFIANYRGFHPRPYFESDKGASTAPKVSF